jgi:hypothetical protein
MLESDFISRNKRIRRTYIEEKAAQHRTEPVQAAKKKKNLSYRVGFALVILGAAFLIIGSLSVFYNLNSFVSKAVPNAINVIGANAFNAELKLYNITETQYQSEVGSFLEFEGGVNLLFGLLAVVSAYMFFMRNSTTRTGKTIWIVVSIFTGILSILLNGLDIGLAGPLFVLAGGILALVGFTRQEKVDSS